MAEYLARGGGRWRAPLPDRDGGPDSLGLWFERTAGGRVLELTVAIYYGDEVRTGLRGYWFWHPGRREIAYHEVAPSGRVRTGASHFTDAETFVTLTDSVSSEGTSTPNRGVNILFADNEHRTTAYALDPKGEWIEQQALTWIRERAVEGPDSAPRKPEMEGILHVGMWVRDPDETLAFLRELSDFTVFSESVRDTGGRRVFVHDTKGQVIEMLTADDVVPHPEFEMHPLGKTAGVAHVAIRVNSVAQLRDKLVSMGYEILHQIPASDSDDPVRNDFGEWRILYVEGPDAITFELIEIQDPRAN